jgi:hypothetical protein
LYVEKLKFKEEKLLCWAVIKNDDTMLRQILAGTLPELNTQPKQQASNELSIVGREIMQSNLTPAKADDVRESKYPRA